jgi:hypothetical protein
MVIPVPTRMRTGCSKDEGGVYGTDPTDPDTDCDGVGDGQEVKDGTDPLGQEPVFDHPDTHATARRYPRSFPCAGYPLKLGLGPPRREVGAGGSAAA